MIIVYLCTLHRYACICKVLIYIQSLRILYYAKLSHSCKVSTYLLCKVSIYMQSLRVLYYAKSPPSCKVSTYLLCKVSIYMQSLRVLYYVKSPPSCKVSMLMLHPYKSCAYLIYLDHTLTHLYK